MKSSFIPDKDIRVLRELTRYRYKLTSMRSSEKNRFQNAFTVCNVALDSVVSDMFGKSATAITDYLTSDEDFDARHCVSLLQCSLKKKADDVLASIEGYEITLEQKTRIGIVRDHLHYIDSLIGRVDIILLDEATSSVDPENEWMLQQAIQELTAGKTVVMIAHKIKTIMNAGQIIVMDNGRVHGIGTHEALLQSDEIYRTFWDARRTASQWKI